MDKNTLPLFPEFVRISLEHKQVFEGYFRKCPPEISEHNFTELFCWHKAHNTKVAVLNENICVLMDKEKEKIYFAPFGNNKIAETMTELLSWQKSKGAKAEIYGVPDGLLQCMETITELSIEKDRDNADYVYSTKELVNLAGKKYDGKRNQIKKFKKNCSFEYTRITKGLAPACAEFQKRWCEMNVCGENHPLYDENLAIQEMLDNFTALNIFGGALMINSKVEAFTIAGELNQDTAVIHAEKANVEFKGIYQAINQVFCEKELVKYKYVNREQDVGDEGLRRAKLSYRPHHMVNKNTIKLKGE